MDIVEYFDGRRTPRELWEFIQRLPKNSRYWAARSVDVEVYEWMQKKSRGHADKAKPEKPRAYDYSPELEAIAAVWHELQHVAYQVANKDVPKGKRKRFKPQQWPTPETAADLVRRRDSQKAKRHLQSVVTYVSDEEWLARFGPGSQHSDSFTRVADT